MQDVDRLPLLEQYFPKCMLDSTDPAWRAEKKKILEDLSLGNCILALLGGQLHNSPMKALRRVQVINPQSPENASQGRSNTPPKKRDRAVQEFSVCGTA